MTIDFLISEIKKYISDIDFDLLKKQITFYKDFLLLENKKYNLTSISEDQIYEHYFFFSILPYFNLLKNNHFKLLDIGSGSGIPGILIKLIYPKISVYIVESSQKKCSFMNKLINELNLKDIFVINKRIEELDKNYREYFDYATSRAFAKLKIILEVSIPFLKINGFLIQPKSKLANIELNESISLINLLKVKLIDNNIINYDNFYHQILVFKKWEKTDSKYPRKWKDIINESKNNLS